MAKKITETIAQDYYCIPKWCRMHPYSHFDGMGGCWGISGGLVLAQGENYCFACDYHMSNIEPPRKPKDVTDFSFEEL